MSAAATFRFLSWVRRGAATRITTPDQSTGGARATLGVEVAFNQNAEVAQTTLELAGPGDIIAFDPRAVVRMWPPPGTLDAEPNAFPLVELDQVDLPWRYTPRAAEAATSRLRPWCCLLALRDGEHTYEPPRADRPLGAIRIPPGTPMPNLAQAWAWAHVQVSGDDGTPLAAALAQPGRCVARVLAPRHLEPNATYWAALVPIFEVGRRAGLRLDLGATAGALGAAWDVTAAGTLAGSDPLVLPVYHRWRFGTGRGGDFESLVRALVPRPLPSTVGLRALDASRPGAGLPAASATALAIGGALQAPETAPPVWPAAERAAFVDALRPILELPANVRAAGGAPVVAPPLYGTWHARRDRLAGPAWFQQLNEDPRTRIAAALGTRVVQAEQQALMAQAWQQAAGLREAADQLRQAQLARAIGDRLHARFVRTADNEAALGLTAALHGHVRHSASATVRAVAAKGLPRAMLAPAARRMFRPLGAVGRRQARPDAAPAPVLARIDDGTYAGVLGALPPPPIANLVTHLWLNQQDIAWGGPPTPSKIASQGPVPNVPAWDPIYGAPAASDPGPPNTDSPSMARFRKAAIDAATFAPVPGAGEVRRRLDLPVLRKRVTDATDPRQAIPRALRDRLALAPGFAWNPADPIEPVMLHPEFPQPMYAPLAALSPDWVLPGLAAVPPDSVALAVTNPAFIEAYLVGLNHEMARELLWNEYPTDQRGSYFRQFWDPAGLAPSPLPETARDLVPIHTWSAASQLGQHSPRPAPPTTDGRHVVLLVRGEVLRRYPGTLVYAQRATGPSGNRTLATEQRAPVFGGRLPPDVSFFGFDLSVAQARGGTSDPGWFFVFQEQPGEPRFGLDVASEHPIAQSWDDLAWTHLAPGVHYIDLAAPQPNTTLAEQPGGPAWRDARGADHAAITLQRPVRVAIHAAEMLPVP